MLVLGAILVSDTFILFRMIRRPLLEALERNIEITSFHTLLATGP